MVSRSWKHNPAILVSLLLVLVFCIRLPFILGGVFGGDPAYHARGALVVLNGGWLYVDVPYSYPPLYAYTEALSIGLLGNTQIGWKAVPQLYDMGSIVLIYLIASKSFGTKAGLLAALIYGLSPLPLVAVSKYVCFDSTASFWMLASTYFLQKQKIVPSALVLGIGTAYKYFPLLLLPLFMTCLPKKHLKLVYLAITTTTIVLIQIPFILYNFSAWYDNVIAIHLSIDGAGYSIYGLFSSSPQLWNVPQTPWMLLQPIALVFTYLLIYLDKDRTPLGLFKKAALILQVAVFFSKDVFFYAQWFIPIIALFVGLLNTRDKFFVGLPFVILQLLLVIGVNFIDTGLSQITLLLGYPYIIACGVLMSWSFWDRLENFRSSSHARFLAIEA
ncbi:MAG TPA: glycosyltransferase family 39 protein [Candidatus Lokiarchaeia archaeon]|nr:glycosyltransferase family 39 protein [Candidatus Lokiarchaeia archaeon]